VLEGNLTFHLGEQRHQVRTGDIVIAPPGGPHKFTNDGPGRSKLVCIHVSPAMSTEWVE
jgi:quercetin dioxygenase-like cupin family protein